jgi:hypothetical protein
MVQLRACLLRSAGFIPVPALKKRKTAWRILVLPDQFTGSHYLENQNGEIKQA